jgi:hypothetical protein
VAPNVSLPLGSDPGANPSQNPVPSAQATANSIQQVASSIFGLANDTQVSSNYLPRKIVVIHTL